jgi:hypothetical protein
MYIWAGIEVDLGVVCACLPSLPVLFKPIIKRVLEHWENSPLGISAHRWASRHGLVKRKPDQLKPSQANSSWWAGDADETRICETRRDSHESQKRSVYELTAEGAVEMGSDAGGSPAAPASFQ